VFVLVLACGSSDAGPASPTADPGQSATATPFQIPNRSPTELELPVRIAVTLPLFEEFAREAGMDNVEVISLIPPGADPHTYEFTPSDIEKMKGIDFFFLNARGLDSRLQDVIEANRDEDAHVIPFAPNILSPQGRGQTAEQAGDNPHLWLDPSLAYVYVEIVADELIIYDGIRKDTYDSNFSAFKQRMLDFQDELYAQIQAVPPERRKLVSYHNSFDHFARKFDLSVAGYAVETPGDVPAPDAIALLAQTVSEQGIPAIFAEFGYDRAVIDQVGAQAGVPVCTLYSDISDAALTYEEMMRANAGEIVRCLGS
jgi:ABC-type Zn uptake system ZnuABC Zn-binding protein ZnuA